MNILLVTPELAPYSGGSPAAEACCALPKALKGLGHQVTVLSPLYGFVDPVGRALARRLRKIEVSLGEARATFEVYDARTSAGVELLFLGHEELFRSCTELPTGADPQDGLRFGAFCKAAIEVIRSAEPAFDLVCAHDWQTALVPALLRSEASMRVPSVLAIHDASRRGLFDAALRERLGLPERAIEGADFRGELCFLKAGVVSADRVIAASPSYAVEISAEGAGGLEDALRARGKDLIGITGGVDGGLWNPATDAHLESRFDPMDLTGKKRSKVAMQRESSLPMRDDVPLIAVPGSIGARGGIDSLARILSRSMRNDAQIVIAHADVGEAEPALLAVLQEHQTRWPDRLHTIARPDPGTMHRLLGAADCVVVASAQVPASTLQMKAHRYGALPIGLRRAAFADTVIDCDAALQSGDGFAFDEPSDEDLLATVQRAIGAYGKRRAFESLRQRAMRIDHSWERSAYLHDRVYKALVH